MTDPALPPHRNARGFHNPPGSPQARGSLGDWLRFFRDLALAPTAVRFPPLPADHVLDADAAIANLAAAGERDSLTWLGHASFLIRLDGRTILTDPYLSDYAAPIAGIGPKRYAGTGIPLARLPPIDLIVLSHNHYDHLDAVALKQLAHRNANPDFIVPLGLERTIRRLGFTQVRALDWGDVHRHATLTITALPAVHFSSRTPFDRNRTLWCGFGLRSAHHHLYFAGDTGWGEVFEHVGRRFGPFDTALVPIGAYAPRELMQAVHANPEEAVRIGRALRAGRLVAMHWGTIRLTTEPPFDAPDQFRSAARSSRYPDGDVWVMRIGETRLLAAAPSPDLA